MQGVKCYSHGKRKEINLFQLSLSVENLNFFQGQLENYFDLLFAIQKSGQRLYFD